MWRLSEEWQEEDEEDDPSFAPGPEADITRLVTAVAKRPRRSARRNADSEASASGARNEAGEKRSRMARGSGAGPSGSDEKAERRTVPRNVSEPNAGPSGRSEPIGKGKKKSGKRQKPQNIKNVSEVEGVDTVNRGATVEDKGTDVEVAISVKSTPNSVSKRKKRKRPDDTSPGAPKSGTEEVAEGLRRGKADSSLNSVPNSPSKKKKRKHSKQPATKTNSSTVEFSATIPPSSMSNSKSGKEKTHRASAKPVDRVPSHAPSGSENGNGLDSGKGEGLANGDGNNNKDDHDAEEIESLFGDLSKRKAAIKGRQSSKQKESSRKGPKERENGKKKRSHDSPARYTEDGLRIVTIDDIAADQPEGLNGKCPFDCSCCF